MNSTLINPKSTHDTPVFDFHYDKVSKHPNADRLGLYTIPDTDYSYVLSLTDWEGYNGKVCWVPPDSLVPVAKEQFNFLPAKADGYSRIRAKRLRGVVSYGLLVKVQDGDDLGVKHYAPEASAVPRGPSVDAAKPSDGVFPKYDVDAFLRYGRMVFTPGELCNITVKYHGENHRCVFKDGEQYVGSCAEWKKEFTSPPSITVEELMAKGIDEARAREIYTSKVTNHTPSRAHWWKGFDNTPGLRKLCEALPGYCVYSEIINTQGRFTYGLPPGHFECRVFDILTPDGRWLPYSDVKATCESFGVPMVETVVSDWPFDFDTVVKYAETLTVPGCPANEGIVIAPVTERWDARLGRVKLKCINPAYLELK